MEFAKRSFIILNLTIIFILTACEAIPPISPESKGQQEILTVQPPETIIDQPKIEYQGLTKEEYDDLQAQKAKYEAMTDMQKQAARESGTIPCKNFNHLWWEDSIDISFINYVGEEAFKEWIDINKNSYFCNDIYSFAKEFNIDSYRLKTIVRENGLEEIYPLDRLESRYNFFRNKATQWEEDFVTPGQDDFALVEITEENRVFTEKNRKITFESIPESEAERVVASTLYYYAANDIIRREAMRLKPSPVDLNNPRVYGHYFTSFTVLNLKTMSETDIAHEVRPNFQTDSLVTEGMFDGFLTIDEYIEKHKLIDPAVILVDEIFTYTGSTLRKGPQLADNTTYRHYYIVSKNADGEYRIADFSFVW